MILQFPDYDTLMLVLTSGVVPPEVSLQPVSAGTDRDGRPWLETAARLAKPALAKLTKLGVESLERRPGEGADLHNWLQAVPLAREEKAAEIGSGAAVIFELPDAAHLPEIVGEMLRLNVDRQSFRWLRDEEGGTGTVLLRVIGPPYYTLLRAIDRDPAGGAAAVRAYVERAPRVWVELGYTHPLVESLEPPEGALLLLRPPHDWAHVAEAPFRDIYEILDFKLPHTRHDWQAADLRKKLIVPLRLVESDQRDAELWVLRDRPLERLDALVRDAKESLVQRLIFAVGEHDGRPLIVLRVRPSKQPPPQLVLEAEAYTKYLKLDNLFVPVGARLHPILRRDAVRKLLAADPNQVNWLRADAGRRGGFIPECLPDDAFRPLQDWVDYVLDRDREALTHWVEEFKFDFDPFVCPEEQAGERARPPVPGRRRGAPADDEALSPRPARPAVAAKAEAPEPEPAPPLEVAAAAPSRLLLELAELEARFLAVDGTLDDPGRLQIWPEMAARHAALKHGADAGICWMNLLWEVLDLDVEEADLKHDPTRREARRARLERLRALVGQLGGETELAGRWLDSEQVLPARRLTAADLDRLLSNEQPSFGEVRGLVACLVWGARDEAASRVILARQAPLQQYLLRHESVVGLRPVWLGWHALAGLSRDALALARARDRLIERLVTDGYSAERDLPIFLRAAGHQDHERLRAIQSHVGRLQELALDWCAESRVGEADNVRQTSGHYVDLIFAFGLARLGEPLRARELLRSAESAIEVYRKGRVVDSDKAAAAAEKPFEVHSFLVRAFRYRIEQVLQGRPHVGPLPAEMRDDLDRLLGDDNSSISRYCVNRMLEQSEILEPQERFNPYRDFTLKHVPELHRRFAALPDIKDARQLHGAIQDLLRAGAGKPPTPEEQLDILAEGLLLAPRVGEALVRDLLARAEAVLPRVPPGDSPALLRSQARLLDCALLMAANYDRVESVQRLWPRFVELLQRAQHSKNPPPEVVRLFGQCLRSMRKLGLRDDISKMIDQAERLVRNGKSIAALQAATDGKEWPIKLMTLLHLAGGWLLFDRADKATDVLDAARELLNSPGDRDNKDGLFPRQYTLLAVTYATVLGQAPVEMALRRIEELFRKMRRMQDTLTTNRYYGWLHLNIIEAVVLAVVSDDFAMGASARRWMDGDEYLVRRRVHRDHRVMVAGA